MGLVNMDLQWEVFLCEHMLLLLQRKASQTATMGSKMHQTSQPTTMISIQSQTFNVAQVKIDHSHTHVQMCQDQNIVFVDLCGMVVHPIRMGIRNIYNGYSIIIVNQCQSIDDHRPVSATYYTHDVCVCVRAQDWNVLFGP